MKGEIELYNISFLILKVELHFNIKYCELDMENFFVCLHLLYIVSCNLNIPTENPPTDFSTREYE